MKLDKAVSTVLLILVGVAVIATVYIIVNPSPGEKFTELYILGAGDKAGNYPTNLSVGEVGNITIGIVNHEQAKTSYNLVVTLNNATLSSQNYTLANNETREINYTFTPTQAGTNQTIEFKLFKLPDNTNVYRSVFLYLNVH